MSHLSPKGIYIIPELGIQFSKELQNYVTHLTNYGFNLRCSWSV